MNVAGSDRALKVTWGLMRFLGRFSSHLSGPVADKLWFTPWRVPLSDRARSKQQGWLAALEQRRFHVGDLDVNAYVGGSGPTVMLVHGWGDSAGSLGAFIDPLLDANHRVVAIDLPAHGGSPGDRTDAFVAATAVRGISDQIGGVAAVIAHSMGALATIVALHEGLRPDAAVVMAPSVDLEHAMDKFAAMFSVPPKAIRGLRASIERRYGKTVWRDLAADALVREVDVPTLIIHDRADAQVDVADAERLATAWAGSHLEITDGLSHTKIVRDPKVVGGAVGFVKARISDASPIPAPMR